MKKHAPPPAAPVRQDKVTLRDYGHDRTIYSLGRGESTRRRRQQKRRMIIGFAALLVILALGTWLVWPMLAGQAPAESTAPQTTPEVTPSATVSETASPTTTETTVETIATLSPAERQGLLADAAGTVATLLAGKNGRFAVYYHNLVNGETWQYNDDAPFVAASSIKLGINTYLYTKIASGEVSPDEILTYDNRPYPTGDYEGGTGTVQGQPNGTPYSVRDTSGLSIRISDNCATNMVIRRLGGIDVINENYLGVISSVVDYRTKVSYTNYAGTAQNGRHRTSARDLGLHAVNLYRLWQENQEVYQPLIDDLCTTTFDFGIQKGIPEEIRVAHKIGTNGMYSAENDVGIVFTEEPFVLCIMTEMASAQAARQIQAEIAGIFYEYISSLQPG